MPPGASQKLGMKGLGKGDATKLRLEMVFLQRHPPALGPLPGKLVGRRPVSAIAHPSRTGRDHPLGVQVRKM